MMRSVVMMLAIGLLQTAIVALWLLDDATVASWLSR